VGLGPRSFSAAGLSAWNSLLSELKNTSLSIGHFVSQLKMKMFTWSRHNSCYKTAWTKYCYWTELILVYIWIAYSYISFLSLLGRTEPVLPIVNVNAQCILCHYALFIHLWHMAPCKCALLERCQPSMHATMSPDDAVSFISDFWLYCIWQWQLDPFPPPSPFFFPSSVFLLWLMTSRDPKRSHSWPIIFEAPYLRNKQGLASETILQR